MSFARLFTGFFISWGLTFTYYEDSRYNENEDMLRKAERWMENPDNYEVITNGVVVAYSTPKYGEVTEEGKIEIKGLKSGKGKTVK